jgi:hypothetical protein
MLATKSAKAHNHRNKNKTKKRPVSKCHPRVQGTIVPKETCVTPDIIDKIDPRPRDHKQKLENLHRSFHCENESGENRDVCVLKKAPPAIQKTLSHNLRPLRPKEWNKNPNMWLSNEDILKVLHQYEEAYPNFHCFEPTPIDFDARLNESSCVRNDLCRFSVDHETRKHITEVGIVFNLDKHDSSGSHWTSMFIDIPRREIYYFDSANDFLPPEVAAFVKRINDSQLAAPPMRFKRNDRAIHQQGDTECGIYSLFFIINMLLCKGNRRALFSRRFNNPRRIIKDKDVEKYRKYFFI